MTYIFRSLEIPVQQALERGKSVMLLGPRQTGKTTFLKHLAFPKEFISLAPAKNRLRYEKDPALLGQEIEALAFKNPSKKPLIIIDEVQKVPALLEEIQDLIDREVAQFILSGSSARKLRKDRVNWLPGRVLIFRMDALSVSELPTLKKSIEDILVYGLLPQVVNLENAPERNRELVSYVSTYLEEEIRAEAAVRNLANFSRFLELAACESGQVINFSKIATDMGVSRNTITSYFQILEDCLIVERIEPLTRSITRSRLTKSPKYLFFDLGVRRVAASEGIAPSLIHKGFLFEQFVGLELIKRCRFTKEMTKLLFWRDPSSIDIDWVIETPNALFPIEVKWTDRPHASDIKNLNKFLDEYPEAQTGYLVCRCEKMLKMTDRIFAIPWAEIHSIGIS